MIPFFGQAPLFTLPQGLPVIGGLPVHLFGVMRCDSGNNTSSSSSTSVRMSRREGSGPSAARPARSPPAAESTLSASFV